MAIRRSPAARATPPSTSDSIVRSEATWKLTAICPDCGRQVQSATDLHLDAILNAHREAGSCHPRRVSGRLSA